MEKELIKQAEAVIFSCGRKIELEELSQLLDAKESELKKALRKLKQDYDSSGSPIMIVEEGTAWKMTVREKYLPLVRKITPYMEFSKTVMETLAVIAWKQPILQSDVISIRTNKAYDHISELQEMGFLTKEKHGRSFLLKLSQKFYDYFDLRGDVDVRKLFSSIKDDEPESQTKVADFPEEDGEIVVEDEITGEEEKTRATPQVIEEQDTATQDEPSADEPELEPTPEPTPEAASEEKATAIASEPKEDNTESEPEEQKDQEKTLEATGKTAIRPAKKAKKRRLGKKRR